MIFDAYITGLDKVSLRWPPPPKENSDHSIVTSSRRGLLGSLAEEFEALWVELLSRLIGRDLPPSVYLTAHGSAQNCLS
jgi:hypothetical protein